MITVKDSDMKSNTAVKSGFLCVCVWRSSWWSNTIWKSYRDKV